MNRFVALKIALYFGAAYYVVGAIAHYFALTIFPWFVGALYVPYQDTVIALVALIIAYFLIVVARDPVKNIDMLKAIIVSALVVSAFSIAVLWKIDFAMLGASEKIFQTVTEGILGFAWSGVLIWLYPRRPPGAAH